MYVYTTDIIGNLEKSISLDRLSTYLAETGGDSERALKLYLWNAELSAAFYAPLQGLEITLRNALHRELVKKFGRDDWYEVAPLKDSEKDKVEAAKVTVRKLHVSVGAPHIVAELSFGFWLSLLNKKYHPSLWIPVLYKSFPNSTGNRADILRNLDHLRILRNRIAHHESIFKRDLLKDYTNVITSISYICGDTSKWIDQHNSVKAIIGRKP